MTIFLNKDERLSCVYVKFEYSNSYLSAYLLSDFDSEKMLLGSICLNEMTYEEKFKENFLALIQELVKTMLEKHYGGNVRVEEIKNSESH